MARGRSCRWKKTATLILLVLMNLQCLSVQTFAEDIQYKSTFSQQKDQREAARFSEAKTELSTLLDRHFNWWKEKTVNSGENTKRLVGIGEGLFKTIGDVTIDTFGWVNKYNPLTQAEKYKDFGVDLLKNSRERLALPVAKGINSGFNVLYQGVTNPVDTAVKGVNTVGGTLVGLGLLMDKGVHTFLKEQDPYKSGEMIGAAVGFVAVSTVGPKKSSPVGAVKTLQAAKAAGVADDAAKIIIPDSLKIPGGMTLQGRINLGGTGEMFSYIDSLKQQWLFKPGQLKNSQVATYRAYVQESAYKVQSIIDRKTAVPVGVGTLDGKFGAFQMMVPDIDNMINLKQWQFYPKTQLPEGVLSQLQREHVTDTLLFNFDGHGGNFLVTKTGNVIGIDKEQSFKHILDSESWKINVNYHPNAVYFEAEPIYNTMYKRFVKGTVDLDLKVSEKYIKRVDSVSNSKYAEIFRDYAEARNGAGKAADELLEKIVERKDTLRESFTEFFDRILAEKAGTV